MVFLSVITPICYLRRMKIYEPYLYHLRSKLCLFQNGKSALLSWCEAGKVSVCATISALLETARLSLSHTENQRAST